jgi:hypothetical protein
MATITKLSRSRFASLLTGTFVFATLSSTAQTLPTEAKPSVKQIGPNEYEVGGIRFNGQTREVRLPAVVNIKEAPIEYLLVHETGKVHESVLRTGVKASDLQVALLLCHFEPGTEGLAHPEAPKDLTPIKPLPLKTPSSNRLKISLEWSVEGTKKQAPLSEWMRDINTYQPAPDLGSWVFSGSYVDEDGFAADRDGSFIAAYLDRNAMINSPAKRNWDDSAWISNPAAIPAEGTEVTVVFSPAPQPQKAPNPPMPTKP